MWGRHTRKMTGAGKARPIWQRTSGAAFSPNDEVVRQLEAWFCRARRIDFPNTPPPVSLDRIVDRLEECGPELEALLERANEVIEAGGDRSGERRAAAPTVQPERTHPLWDRELDG